MEEVGDVLPEGADGDEHQDYPHDVKLENNEKKSGERNQHIPEQPHFLPE